MKKNSCGEKQLWFCQTLEKGMQEWGKAPSMFLPPAHVLSESVCKDFVWGHF